MEGGVVERDHDTDDEEEDESEETVLPPDLPQWDKSVSFEGLGRDVVGLIAKRLNANDCFNLALTSKRTYERIKALRLLRGSQERFLSRYPKANLKCLQVRPLVLDMLTCPLPRLAELQPPRGPEGEPRKKCVVCYHIHTEAVQFVARLMEMRGLEVRGIQFDPTNEKAWGAEQRNMPQAAPPERPVARAVSARRAAAAAGKEAKAAKNAPRAFPVAHDTRSKLIQRLRDSGKLKGIDDHTRNVKVGGVYLLQGGNITAEVSSGARVVVSF
jgi:hypothetical protein